MMQAQTQIIAHRGFWKTDPPTIENSLKSLENAQNLNIYGAEFDVRMSKDGVLIVYHDEHYSDLEISETNFEDLEKLKLKSGENLPTLKDYLKKGKKNPSLKLMIELKPINSKTKENELVQKAIQLVKELQVESQTEFISFSLNICERIKKEEPAFKVHYLNGDLSPLEIKEKGLDGLDYHYSIFMTNPTWISQAKTLGLITNSWTVNDVEIFKLLKKQGIDFVTTDIPHLLLKIS
ncbi:glycerophosphodiester phosphodiesterase [Kaistella flava (ex Peng et al. 2021)]|uniref:Glycerophosphodiester phosphodiesterase n=1 Tax=Kaistella flava (ex Peng et al. 2021) TaxID=2038776 RepID=A0A7M2Y4L2_9FLAO|nr:glycerophosphodiester phosphodiesterase family protein [Kaistella flava (ex Peng et al. 2021)]QOW09036.1 glycerophosphodiester phosphodiesterase [Kaistella flava (ex Peng et al. 2021)]